MWCSLANKNFPHYSIMLKTINTKEICVEHSSHSRKRLIRYHKTILQTTTVFGLWFWSLLALLKFVTTVQYTNALKVFTVFWVSQEAYENKEFPRKKRQMRATSYSVQVMHSLNEVNLLVVIHINEPLLTQSPWCNN